MAIPLCQAELDPSLYNCSNPFPDCRSPTGFDFPVLAAVTACIAACPSDARLFDAISLTQRTCEVIVGSDAATVYPGQDIWTRLTTWKFPLLQLVAVFPRAPLSLVTEFFQLVHVLGDPIGTIANLLLKARSCQRRAEFWKARFKHELQDLLEGDESSPRYPPSTRVLKQLTIIVDSYDEWGQNVGDTVQEALRRSLSPHYGHTLAQRKRFLEVCQLTAKALAADRATKFLPISVALGFFIGTIGIAFAKTPSSSAGPVPQTYVNIEAHSIAFSALYFWIVLAVFLGSVIGASQTENAIPRILHRFQKEVPNEISNWHVHGPDARVLDQKVLREFSGGLYSWWPWNFRSAGTGQASASHPHASSLSSSPRAGNAAPGIALASAIGLLSMILCILTAVFISYWVPSFGFGCRSLSELLLALVWVISYGLNFIPFSSHKWAFGVALTKDFICMLATMGGIVATQVGILNRCSCYTMFGQTGLTLPVAEWAADFLFRSIAREYPLATFGCIIIQLTVLPGFISVRYRLAMRVFLQRDDDQSNLRWWHAMQDFFAPRSGAAGSAPAGQWAAQTLFSSQGSIHRFFRRLGRVPTGSLHGGQKEQGPDVPLPPVQPHEDGQAESSGRDSDLQAAITLVYEREISGGDGSARASSNTPTAMTENLRVRKAKTS